MNAISINILTDGIILLLLLACTLSIILLITNYRLKREANRIVEYSVNVNAKINEEVPKILEDMTNECFDEYMALNVAYKNKEYIDAEKEAAIMKEVGNMVAQRISPAALDKLSTYYNINMISEIISNKVYLLVMAYSIQNNQVDENSGN